MRKRFAFQVALCTTAVCTLASGPSADPNTFHYGGQVGLTEARLTDLSALQYRFTIPVSANFPRVTVTVTGGETSFNPGIAFGGWATT